MADPVEEVLRLVAEGRLTPAEAAPILDAIAAGGRERRGPASGGQSAPRPGAWMAGAGGPGGAAPGGPGGRGPGGTGDRSGAGDATGATGGGAPSRIRVQVRENGRVVVDLKVPGVLAGLAGSLPGIPLGYADRLREALRTGLRGPIVDIRDEDDSGLTITID